MCCPPFLGNSIMLLVTLSHPHVSILYQYNLPPNYIISHHIPLTSHLNLPLKCFLFASSQAQPHLDQPVVTPSFSTEEFGGTSGLNEDPKPWQDQKPGHLEPGPGTLGEKKASGPLKTAGIFFGLKVLPNFLCKVLCRVHVNNVDPAFQSIQKKWVVNTQHHRIHQMNPVH